MLVLEFASNGDLLSYLRQCSALPDIQLNAPRFGNDTTAMEIFRKLTMYAWHVAKGMCHLEKLKVYPKSCCFEYDSMYTISCSVY